MRFTTYHLGPDIGGAAANARADANDGLWEQYQSAAIDYLAQQCNRYFGVNFVELYLDKDELVVDTEYEFHPSFYPLLREPEQTYTFEQVPVEIVVQYLNNQGEYVDLEEGVDYILYDRKYPASIKLLELETPIEDGDPDGYSYYRIVLLFGEERYPARFKQAYLLLTGHFYNQREAEVIGAITTEVKMGVDRLIGSLRNYKDVPTR
jgi:hypothetical protein